MGTLTLEPEFSPDVYEYHTTWTNGVDDAEQMFIATPTIDGSNIKGYWDPDDQSGGIRPMVIWDYGQPFYFESLVANCHITFVVSKDGYQSTVYSVDIDNG